MKTKQPPTLYDIMVEFNKALSALDKAVDRILADRKKR